MKIDKKKAALYAAGIPQVRNMLGDLRNLLSTAGGFFPAIIRALNPKGSNGEMVVDTRLVTDRENKFDEFIIATGATTETVKKNYLGNWIAAWGIMALLILSAYIVTSLNLMPGNVIFFVFFWFVCTMSAIEANYKMEMARKQSIIEPISFIVGFLTNPLRWFPMLLPSDYVLRTEKRG